MKPSEQQVPVSIGVEASPGNGYPTNLKSITVAALEYAAQGWAVLLLVPGSKVPLAGMHGYKDATQNPEILQALWALHPGANVGIATGATNSLLVIDVDVKAGALGMKSVAELQTQVGAFTTKVARTPSGGRHYYFKLHEPLPCRTNLLPGIDVRANGGYIVAPPSVVGGKPYEWLSSEVIADAPSALVKFIRQHTAKPLGFVHKVFSGVPQGERNDFVFRYACRLKAKGLEDHEIYALSLEQAAKCSPPLDPKEATACVKSALKYLTSWSCDDTGNARRFSERFHRNVKHCSGIGWMVRRAGGTWDINSKSEVMEMAKDVRDLIKVDAENTKDQIRKQALHKWAKHTASRPGIENFLKLSESEPSVAIRASELNRDPYLLGTPTGVLDLRTQQLVSIDEFITRRTGTVFDEKATCPIFLAFIDQIFSGNKELMAFVQRAVGYSLSGLKDEQVFFFLYGTGANGKSTFLNVLKFVLGDYYCEIAARDLMHEGSRFALARLAGARLVRASEVEADQQLKEGLIKDLTGGDPVTAEFKGRDQFTFVPSMKLWLYGNHKPLIRDPSLGMWRRVLVVPFTVTIPEHERDKGLEEKLRSEAAGILNWALAGFQSWRQGGLKPPTIVMNEVQQYQKDQINFDGWLSECCQSEPSAKIAAQVLWDSYCSWCDQGGEVPSSRKRLSQWLLGKGYKNFKKAGSMFFYGISAKAGP